MPLEFSQQTGEDLLTVDQFGGVDFSTQPSKVSLNRSPDAANMLMNQDGYMEKRTGYRRVYEGAGAINGIYSYQVSPFGSFDGRLVLIHQGTNLIQAALNSDGTFAVVKTLLTQLADTKSVGFELNGAFFILDAKRYIKLLWDTTIPTLVYGYVDAKLSGLTASTHVITGRTPTATDSAPLYDGNVNDYFHFGEKRYFKITFTSNGNPYCWLKKVAVGKKLYLFSVKVGGNTPTYELRNEGDAYVKLTSHTSSGNPVEIVFSTEEEYVYRPTLVTGRNLVSSSGTSDYAYSGTALEAANLACSKRSMEFVYDAAIAGTTGYYALHLEPLRGSIIPAGAVTAVYHNGVLQSGYNAYGAYRVTFSNTAFQNGDKLKVEYEVYEPYANTGTINRCTICGLFGSNNDTRTFLAGNSSAPGTDYTGRMYDATYFAESDATKIGDDSAAIIGYHRLYSNQIIIKDGSGGDATQYLRQAESSTGSNTVFSVKQGAAGEGASCKASFHTVGSIPFYLGPNGVFAIAGTNVADQNNALPRSERINGRLLKHDLKSCVCAAYKGRYLIAIDGSIYLCDTVLKGEWFYWTGFPSITCFWTEDEKLYFGTADGRICRFFQEDEQNAYCDDVAIDGDAQNASAIHAYWSLPQTALGDWTHYKTIRDFTVTCMPYKRSGVEIFCSTEEMQDEKLFDQTIDLFDWNELDFGRLTFRTIQSPVPFSTGISLKKVYVFSAKLQNKAKNEPFGFLALGIRYLTRK